MRSWEKKESSSKKPYLSKKKSCEICRKGHFETRKANLQWIKQNPKIHEGKTEGKVGKAS